MGRGSVIRPCLALRHIIRNTSSCWSLFSSLNEAPISSSANIKVSPASMVPSKSKPLFDCNIAPISTCNYQFSPHFTLSRSICSSSSGPSNIVMIESEEEFNSSLHKVKDESSPAIFYFTATWCGPCRLLSPVIAQLSENYPHVTTYKIDIDQEGLAMKLSELDIRSVPTLHFFQNGKKASELIGADLQCLKDTMEKLYG